MDCQDWNTITFNNISKDKEKEQRKKIHSNKTNNDPEKVRLEAPKELGKLIAAARTAKNLKRKDLALILGISEQILGRWESNITIPNNSEIANIEKKLQIKLPRCKKVTAKDI